MRGLFAYYLWVTPIFLLPFLSLADKPDAVRAQAVRDILQAESCTCMVEFRISFNGNLIRTQRSRKLERIPEGTDCTILNFSGTRKKPAGGGERTVTVTRVCKLATGTEKAKVGTWRGQRE